MSDEERKAPNTPNLIRVSNTGSALTIPSLVSRGLDLALQIAREPRHVQLATPDWKCIVCISDVGLLNMSSAQLTMHGYHVTQVRNPAEMRKLFQKQMFHLVVTDMNSDALDVAATFHRGDTRIPAITATSLGNDVLFRGAPFLVWPYDRERPPSKPQRFGTQLTPEMVEHLVDTGIYQYQNEGVWEFSEWSRKVIEDVGEWARPYLQTIFDELYQTEQNFDQMRRVLYRDAFTGLFNRTYFEMRIVEELERAKRFNGRFSLLITDIDHFGRLNDEFGNEMGDEVLRTVATVLGQKTRRSDMVCRYSNDDFMIIVPEMTADNGMRLAEIIRREIEAHHFPSVPHVVTASCGVAEYPSHGTTRDELVDAADAALAQARSLGYNRVCKAAEGHS